MQRLAETFSEERSQPRVAVGRRRRRLDGGPARRAPALPLVLRPAPLGVGASVSPGMSRGQTLGHAPAARRDAVGASIPPMAEQDFMPLEGWDHLELWVGNAKQAAYFYEHALGFTRTAYAGPETGVRDRASLRARAGRDPARLTSGLRRDSEIGAFRRAPRRRRRRTSRSSVPDAGEAYREAIAARRARHRRAPLASRTSTAASSCRRSRRTATSSTRSSSAATTRAPTCPASSRSSPRTAPRAAGSACSRSTTSSATSSSAGWTTGSSSTSGSSG